MKSNLSIGKVIVVICVICCALFIIVLAHQNVIDSHRLVTAIREGDDAVISSIVAKNPNCVNTIPTIAPAWLSALMGTRYAYPLTEACIQADADTVKLLVEAGADVNGNTGLTALSVTYQQKRENWYEISRYLIDHGASLDYQTMHFGDRSAILYDIAASCGTEIFTPEEERNVISAFQYALENCDHTRIDWPRVLQECVTYDHVTLVQLLLDKGYCQVNEGKNMTPLMFAARDSDTEMLRLLVDYGADLTAVSEDGKTALDYAQEHGRMENEALLRQLGAT